MFIDFSKVEGVTEEMLAVLGRDDVQQYAEVSFNNRSEIMVGESKAAFKARMDSLDAKLKAAESERDMMAGKLSALGDIDPDEIPVLIEAKKQTPQLTGMLDELKAKHEATLKSLQEKEMKARSAEYYKENADAAKEAQSKYRDSNRAKSRAYSRKYRTENLQRMRELHRAWRLENKENTAIRRILYRVLQRIGLKKERKTEEMLGYSASDLKLHMEKQFSRGMSWDNYGDWHIDHIVSINQMVTDGETDPAKINCLSNLMPIWAKDNRKKSCKKVFLL